MKSIVSHVAVSGFPAIELKNDRVRALIVPALGGRVWELTDLRRGRQWIWQRPGVPLKAYAPGEASYDDVWAGGWEELFPNDAAGLFEGRQLPDHGEWWATAWQASVVTGEDAIIVRLKAELSIVKATCVKEFRLPHDAATLTVSYRIRSRESSPFHFLFKQHLPVELTPGCRLALPGGHTTPVDPTFGTLVSGGGPFPWPRAQRPHGVVDMSVVPDAPNKSQEFLYVSDLPEPWCGIDDTHSNASLRMQFEARNLPFVWLFISYGGWRDAHTVVLEPCSNKPKDLAQAVKLGQSARLEPGKEFTTAVSVTITDLLPANQASD